MIIKVLDPVDCRVVKASKEELSWLWGILSYHGEWYKRNQYGGETKQYTASFLQRGHFPAGFLERILKHCDKAPGRIEINKITENPHPSPKQGGILPNITLREEQTRLVDSALAKKQGVLVSPTGSGKTVLAGSILKALNGAKVQFITHSTDIVTQTRKEFSAWGLDHVVITTRQALCESVGGKTKIKSKHQEDLLNADVVMIDEVHKFGDVGGQYHTILRSTLAPYRIGLTATMPTDQKMLMLIEGMLGPVIDSVSYEEGMAKNILAPIKIQLLGVPVNTELERLSRYRDLVWEGIVQNRARNRAILEKAHTLNAEGLSVLVFVQEIEHGHALERMAKVLDFPVTFIRGETDQVDRDLVKSDLLGKETLCVITTQIWSEGVNIPNLNAVILAGGGKSKLSILQRIGRGLRKAEGKEHAIIVDVLDPYDYLAKHTVQRLLTYVEKGWL